MAPPRTRRRAGSLSPLARGAIFLHAGLDHNFIWIIPSEKGARSAGEWRYGGMARTKIAQGWPKLRDLAQHFD
jgi:hypothetical protein